MRPPTPAQSTLIGARSRPSTILRNVPRPFQSSAKAPCLAVISCAMRAHATGGYADAFTSSRMSRVTAAISSSTFNFRVTGAGSE